MPFDIDEIKRALAAATPGPWGVDFDGVPRICDGRCGNDHNGCSTIAFLEEHDTIDDAHAKVNTALLAAAPAWLAELVERVERAEAAINGVFQAVDYAAHDWERRGCQGWAFPLPLDLTGWSVADIVRALGRHADKAVARAETAEAEVARLKAALVRYGGHWMEKSGPGCGVYTDEPCTCGLDAALAGDVP